MTSKMSLERSLNRMKHFSVSPGQKKDLPRPARKRGGDKKDNCRKILKYSP